MTKYILHGGASKIINENNKSYFEETVKGASNVLIVQFARRKEIWDDIFVNVSKQLQNASNSELNIEMGDENIEKFGEQIKWADSLYLMGGNTHFLQEYLGKIDNIDKLWTNKTVSGSSAGALVLCKFYYENDDDTYNEGLNILPYKCFCHYDENKTIQYDKLEKFGDNTEILTLEETNFVIFEK